SRYGFCSKCGILRCSPIWCICGHKQLSDGWTSNNRLLDELIEKSQLLTKSANDRYWEWIPYDFIESDEADKNELYLNGPPLSYCQVKLIPLDMTDEADVSYYEK